MINLYGITRYLITCKNSTFWLYNEDIYDHFRLINLNVNDTFLGDQTLETKEFKDVDPSLIKTGIFNHCRRFRCVAFCNNNIVWWTQITKLNISEIKLRNSSIASLIFCVWHLFFGRKYSSETPVLLWTKRYTVKKRLKTPEKWLLIQSVLRK